jgi:SprT-like protein
MSFDLEAAKAINDEESDSKLCFGDEMSESDLKEAIEDYQNWCNNHYEDLEVDLSEIPVEISHKMKRTAGKVKFNKSTKRIKVIRYAFKAYQEWGWKKFAKTIRHELIHIHTLQNHDKGGHGALFKSLVDPLDTHRHCEKFATKDAKYLLSCKECGQEVAQRFRKSKTVKNPEKYRSNCCNEVLEVETL